MDGETESGPAALQGFCLLKSLLTSLSMMEWDVTVVWEEGACWGVGGGADGLELVDGVTGDGVRTVPLSIKATVKLIQVVGQVQDINGVEGFSPVQTQPETPERAGVESTVI